MLNLSHEDLMLLHFPMDHAWGQINLACLPYWLKPEQNTGYQSGLVD